MKPAKLGPFLGENNRLPRHALHVEKTGDFLAATQNVDLDDSGRLSRANGTTLVEALAAGRSGFSANGFSLLADGTDLLSIVSFVALYLFVTLLGVLAMIPFSPDIQTAGSATIACISNVGPGFSTVGPTMNFAAIPEAGQAILTLLMLVGRLELYTVLALILPAFWRK